MDSLAGVSFYNWLGQHFSVFILLVDCLQGTSIQFIAKHIFDKLDEQRQATITAAPTISTVMASDDNNEHQLTNGPSSYTGMNNDIHVIQPRINSSTCQRIIFGIDTSSPSLEKTVFEKQLLKCVVFNLAVRICWWSSAGRANTSLAK
jgi:hypothetical protein